MATAEPRMPPSELVEPVRAAARRWPQAPALTGPSGTLGYRELIEAVDATAAVLREAGVRPGDVLALRVERDERLPVLLLAAWSAGACVALVDSTLPEARAAACGAVVRPRWRLTGSGLEPSGVRDPRPSRGGSHILLTSGSTGSPAAVLADAGAVRRSLDWYAGAFAPGRDDRVALLAGLGHDPLLRDLLVPLGSGGRLLAPPADVFGHPSALAGFVRSARPSILHATPALLELLLAADGESLGPLRLIVSGGARLTAGLARRLRAVTRAVLVNAYGATETPQIASCAVVDDTSLDAADDSSLEVGSGVAGAELLLDPESGEVVVRSPNLALGYLDGTGRGERFGADPHGEPGYRVYRTGDRGERLPGGGIRITGRLDRELSVNGFRIAPEEIESAARRHPAVHEAQAQALPGPAGQVLGLTVVPRAGLDPTRAELRAHLAALLPRHAVPARIRVLPELALGPNHKVTPGSWS